MLSVSDSLDPDQDLQSGSKFFHGMMYAVI